MEALLRIWSGTSLALLLVGLGLWLSARPGAASVTLNSGLLLLMAMPVLRLLSALTEEVRARDWRFAALGLAVLVLLGGSLAVSLAGRT